MPFYKLIAVIISAICAGMPVYGQKYKVFSQAADAALTRKAATELFTKQSRIYDPVLGYIVPLPPMPPHPAGALTVFTSHTQDPHPGRHLMQVAPLKRPLTNIFRSEAFVRGDLMTPGELSQAVYLWQLAHPWQRLEKYPYLWQKAQDVYTYMTQQFSDYYVEYLPNLKLLKRLLTPGFTSLSFAKLLELTPVYPKHITLSDVGFPVHTQQADIADMLDTYLMLSNPREMSAFVNVGDVPTLVRTTSYRPFVLTQEERIAANELYARRLDSEKLPANATARDLVELAYNRLETHAVKYTQVNEHTPVDFKVYPNYKNTHLYRSIQGAVIGQWPVVWAINGHYVLQNPDTVHLMVLNAVMGGVDPKNYPEVNRTLEAFRELCAHTPATTENISHLTVLQQNLRLAFAPLIKQYLQQDVKQFTSSEQWHAGNIAYRTWELLVKQNVRDLTGLNYR